MAASSAWQGILGRLWWELGGVHSDSGRERRLVEGVRWQDLGRY
jgi:hypothetical protein